MGSVAVVAELQEEQERSGGCGSGSPVLTLESGPLDQVEPVAAALPPEDLVVTAGAPGDGKQSGGLHEKVPVQSRPWMGRHQLR